MFSEEDREMMLHIRQLLANEDKLPEYHETRNCVVLNINGDFPHRLNLFQYKNVLTVMSIEGIDALNSKEKLALHLAKMNATMCMGGFVYDAITDSFFYKLSFPLHEKPTKEFIHNIILFVVSLLDAKMPEIISKVKSNWKTNGLANRPTFH